MACGTNLLTGQKISEERRTAKRKRKLSPGLIVLVLAAAAAVVVIGLLILSAAGDPVAEATQLVAEGNLLDAQNVLRNYLDDQPDDEEAQLLLGKIQFRNNQFMEAAQSFERAAELNRKDTDALRLAVSSYAAAGDAPSRAKQVAALERIVERETDDAEAWYLLGLARGAQGNPEGQAAALSRVLELDPDHAGALRGLAVALALQGDFQQAQDILARAAAAGSANIGDVNAAKGFLAALQDDSKNAIAGLTAAVASQTAAQAPALTQLGIEFIAMGRFAEAEKHLAQAVSAGGRAAGDAARFFHGTALRALGRPDEALSEFDILTKGIGPYQVDAAVQAAQIYLERGNLARARETLESVAAQAGGNAAVHTMRGRISVLNGDDQRALEAYQQAIQTDPSYPAAHLELGLLRLKGGTFGQALQSLARYLELIGDTVDDPQVQQIRTLVDQLSSNEGRSGTAGVAMAPQAGQQP